MACEVKVVKAVEKQCAIADIEDFRTHSDPVATPDLNRLLRRDNVDILQALKSGGIQHKGAEQIRKALRKFSKDASTPFVQNIHRKSNKEVAKYFQTFDGVSLKIALCVMLYAMKRRVFPVDVNVLRLYGNLGAFTHMGITHKNVNDSEAAKGQMLHKANKMCLEVLSNGDDMKISVERLLDAHATLIAYCASFCIKGSEKCGSCPFGKSGNKMCAQAKKGAGPSVLKQAQCIIDKNPIRQQCRVYAITGQDPNRIVFIPCNPMSFTQGHVDGFLLMAPITAFKGNFPMRGTYFLPGELLLLDKMKSLPLHKVPVLNREIKARTRWRKHRKPGELFNCPTKDVAKRWTIFGKSGRGIMKDRKTEQMSLIMDMENNRCHLCMKIFHPPFKIRRLPGNVVRGLLNAQLT